MKRIMSCITTILALSISPLVSASVIYQNDFSTSDVTGWSSDISTSMISTDLAGERFLGLLGAFHPNSKPDPWTGENVKLVLDSVGAGHYSIQFDIFTINTWDGDSTTTGPDEISFSINDSSVFSGWFSSSGSNSAGLSTSGSNILKFNDDFGQVIGNNRYSPTFLFYHGGGKLTFSFLGKPSQPEQLNGNTGFYDEPWALDNVVVSTVSIPEPATMLLLGAGLMGLAGLRRTMRQ